MHETVDQTKQRLRQVEQTIRSEQMACTPSSDKELDGQLEMFNLDTILKERKVRYGKFTDHARVSQDVKSTITVGIAGSRFSPSQKEALEMIAHKIGRIVCGDPNYIDSWDDIAGYAKLVADELRSLKACKP